MTNEPSPEYRLSEREAFYAMVEFLKAFYDRWNGKVELGIVLSDLIVQSDGGTKDPAAWFDWIDSIEKVRTRQSAEPGEGHHLSL